MNAMRLMVPLIFIHASADKRILYYTYYQDPFCTANNAPCTSVGCCDNQAQSKTLLDPETWPDCPGGGNLMPDSILINPLAPNELGGLDLDYMGTYYAAGATYENASGYVLDWQLNPRTEQCGGATHDSPYSYNIPVGHPDPKPLCVPATPPKALNDAILGLQHRGIRVGFSILGGAGGDNIPVPNRTRLPAIAKLPENRFQAFLVQVSAAAEVLRGWGIGHFDVDFEGGVASDLNVTRLRLFLNALRGPDTLVTLTTEIGSLDPLTSLLQSQARPDLIQLMLSNYYTPIVEGLKQVQNVSKSVGYAVSNFTLGVKPDCTAGVVGSLANLKKSLPVIERSGVGLMLWDMGRDYPCSGDCTIGCKKGSKVGQAPFTDSPPLAFSCAMASKKTSTYFV